MEPYRLHLRTNGEVALIDPADEPLVRPYQWYLIDSRRMTGGRRVRGYREYRDGRPDFVTLGRLILGITDPAIFVDHINGDTTDNRRANLRLATIAQNTRNSGIHRDNTSGFKGVSRRLDTGRWIATISHQGKTRVLGYSASVEEAARMYDAGARDLHGAFARLNFPGPGERSART